MKNQILPMANAVVSGSNNRKLDAILHSGKLTGLANNTKWNELITAIRNWDNWRPSYRTKCINGFVSGWDAEWFYHLPFPFKYTLWFDIGCHQADSGKIIDRSEAITKLVSSIGFDHELREDVLRIFGYAPRDYECWRQS